MKIPFAHKIALWWVSIEFLLSPAIGMGLAHSGLPTLAAMYVMVLLFAIPMALLVYGAFYCPQVTEQPHD